MASTIDLDAVIGHALARGASVQPLRRRPRTGVDLGRRGAARPRRPPRRRHLKRGRALHHPQNRARRRAPSLALRASDPAGIGFYIDHHRVNVGTDTLAADIRYATAATWQSSKLPISTANRLPGCDCHGVCHRGSAVTDRRLGAGHPRWLTASAQYIAKPAGVTIEPLCCRANTRH